MSNLYVTLLLTCIYYVNTFIFKRKNLDFQTQQQQKKPPSITLSDSEFIISFSKHHLLQ